MTAIFKIDNQRGVYIFLSPWNQRKRFWDSISCWLSDDWLFQELGLQQPHPGPAFPINFTHLATELWLKCNLVSFFLLNQIKHWGQGRKQRRRRKDGSSYFFLSPSHFLTCALTPEMNNLASGRQACTRGPHLVLIPCTMSDIPVDLITPTDVGMRLPAESGNWSPQTALWF